MSHNRPNLTEVDAYAINSFVATSQRTVLFSINNGLYFSYPLQPVEVVEPQFTNLWADTLFFDYNTNISQVLYANRGKFSTLIFLTSLWPSYTVQHPNGGPFKDLKKFSS